MWLSNVDGDVFASSFSAHPSTLPSQMNRECSCNLGEGDELHLDYKGVQSFQWTKQPSTVIYPWDWPPTKFYDIPALPSAGTHGRWPATYHAGIWVGRDATSGEMDGLRRV
ncbi:hypothetical protein NMY22_g3096 [Coprinellus aureogranulatus]|nr:hypothetical protein NMY22_g3096 [Coprinellus aureogranulatus]